MPTVKQSTETKTWGDKAANGVIFVCGALFVLVGILMTTPFYGDSFQKSQHFGITLVAFGGFIAFFGWKLLRSSSKNLDMEIKHTPITQQRLYWKHELRDILILTVLYSVAMSLMLLNTFEFTAALSFLVGLCFFVARLSKCARELKAVRENSV